MKQDLKKDYFWNTLGALVTAGTSFLLTIIIARINSTDSLGVYNLSFGMAMIFAMIAFFGGRNFQVTDTKDKFLPRTYLKQRVLMGVLAMLAGVIFVIANRYGWDLSICFLSFLFYKVLDSLTDAIAGIFQKKNYLWVGGKSGFFKALAGIGLFIVVDLLTHNIVWASLSFPIVYIIGIMTYDKYWLRKTKALVKQRKTDQGVKALLKATYLVAGVSFLQVAIINILRYFVDVFRPEEQAVFGIILLPAFVVNLLMAFIISPQLTFMARAYHQRQWDVLRKTVSRMGLIIFAVGVVAVGAAYFLAVPVIRFIYGYDLLLYRNLIIISVLAGVFYAWTVLFLAILTIYRRIKIQIVILFSGLLLEIFIIVLFGGEYGLGAIMIAYLLSQVLQVIVLFTVYKSLFKDNSIQGHRVILKILEFGRSFNKKIFKQKPIIFLMRQVLSAQAMVMMLIYLPTFLTTSRKYVKRYGKLDYQKDKDLSKILGQTTKKSNTVKQGKTLWQFWDSGYEEIPEGIKVCVDRTKEVTKQSGYDYVLITDNNLEDYLELPSFIMDKYSSGIITKPLFSDILRVALLYKYGGLWVDTTYYLDKKVDLQMANQTFFTLHKRLGAFAGNPALSRWLENFIGSNQSGYPLFGFCLTGFFDYWRQHQEPPKEYLFIDYLIIAFYKSNKEFRQTIKSMRPNFLGVGALSLLSNYFHNSVIFDKKTQQRLLSQAGFYHKLDFKYSKDEYYKNKETFYKKFINRKLDF